MEEGERERERVETRTRGGVGACESCLLARRRHLLLLQSTLLSPSVLSPPPSLISLFSFLLERVSYRAFLSFSSFSLSSTYLDSLTCRRGAERLERVRLVAQDYLRNSIARIVSLRASRHTTGEHCSMCTGDRVSPLFKRFLFIILLQEAEMMLSSFIYLLLYFSIPL